MKENSPGRLTSQVDDKRGSVIESKEEIDWKPVFLTFSVEIIRHSNGLAGSY
jgi:hypothetical protein